MTSSGSHRKGGDGLLTTSPHGVGRNSVSPCLPVLETASTGRSFSCFSSGKGPVFQPLVGLHGTLPSWTVGVSGKAELLGRGPWAWVPSQFRILCPGRSDQPPSLSQSPVSSSAQGGNVGPLVMGTRPMSGGGEPLRAAPSLPLGRISTSQDGASSWSRSVGLGSLHHAPGPRPWLTDAHSPRRSSPPRGIY